MVAKGKVLMVKASYKDEWTFPGGVVDEDESPQAAALRELQEEVGVTLRPDDIQFLGVVYSAPNDGFKDRYNFAFYTNVATEDTPLTLDPSEIEFAEWVPISEISARANGRGSYHIFQELIQNSTSGTYREAGGH